MSIRHLQHRQEVISTDVGDVLGISYRWPGGQYCALHTDRGIVGCGLYDVTVGTKFGMAIAIARGTPEHPLFEPEDLLEARIVEVSEAAEALGVWPGMTGREAIGRLLAFSAQADGGITGSSMRRGSTQEGFGTA